MAKANSYIFLNDRQSLAALDRTFIAQTRTDIYELVYRAKFSSDSKAISVLVGHCLKFLDEFSYFKAVDYLCAVPSRKDYDLPREIAASLSEELSLPDITSSFLFQGEKTSTRQLSVSQKRRNLKNAGIIYDGESLKNKKVLLLDDNYQSGITMNFIGQLLKNHGLMNIYGLAMTKTWSDTDNLGGANE